MKQLRCGRCGLSADVAKYLNAQAGVKVTAELVTAADISPTDLFDGRVNFAVLGALGVTNADDQ